MANEYGIGFWGQNAWGENSDVFVSVTGQQLSSNNIGTVSVTTEINTGWGRLTWGAEDWGTTGISVISSVTGNSLSVTSGTAQSSALTIASPTGLSASFALSGVDPSPDAFASGIQIPIQVGSPSIIADASLSLTGNSLSITSGTAQSSALTIASPTGLGLAAANPGTVIVGGIANVPVTGNQLSVAEGTVDVAPDVALTGQQISSAVGTAVLDANTIAAVTGQQLTPALGTVTFTITGSVQLTGNSLTIALGNESSQVWTIVDTGTTVAYSEISTGTSVTFTEVSTGTSVTWNEIDTAA